MDVFAPYEQAPQREAESRHRAAQSEKRLHAAVDALMDNADGRCLLRWLIQLSQCFQALSPAQGSMPHGLDAQNLAFTEGRRLVGMRLLALMQQADPGHLPRLLLSKADDI